jgi:hypothetical protein
MPDFRGAGIKFFIFRCLQKSRDAPFFIVPRSFEVTVQIYESKNNFNISADFGDRRDDHGGGGFCRFI